MIRGLVGEFEREVVDLIASPARPSARIRELISRATLEERRKSHGPGRDRTCDLGIKSAGATARDCVWLKEPARLSIHSCRKLRGIAGHGDKPVLPFVLPDSN